MRSVSCCEITILSVLIGSALSATTTFSTRGGDSKLNYLDKHGYEVISDAEEILTPVVKNSDGSASGGSSDMLFYGRFYVLRKRVTTADASAGRKTNMISNPSINPTPYFQFGGPPPPRGDKGRLSAAQAQEEAQDAIVFSDEVPTTAKSYKREQRNNRAVLSTSTSTPSSHNDEWIIPREPELGQRVVPGFIGEFQKPGPGSRPRLPLLERKWETMSPDEFVEWAKNNLDLDTLCRLLYDEDGSTSDTTPQSQCVLQDYQYNSFITVPQLQCPSGQRKNHAGKCTPPYNHVPTKHEVVLLRRKLNKSSEARLKVMELLRVLSKGEERVLKEFEEVVEQTTTTTTPTTTPHSKR